MSSVLAARLVNGEIVTELSRNKCPINKSDVANASITGFVYAINDRKRPPLLLS